MHVDTQEVIWQTWAPHKCRASTTIGSESFARTELLLPGMEYYKKTKRFSILRAIFFLIAALFKATFQHCCYYNATFPSLGSTSIVFSVLNTRCTRRYMVFRWLTYCWYFGIQSVLMVDVLLIL